MNNQPDSAIKFFHHPAASGILLIVAAALALIIANTPLSDLYHDIMNLILQVRVADINVEKPLLLWINDGLMAMFFFVVGLELKREILGGELSSIDRILLPSVGAIGGMAVPAAIYSAINWGDPVAMRGWAIPAATDIAFALGVLSILGPRVPTSLKVFLVSLAIIDDIGAIIIIALFYTAELSFRALALASACLVVLFVINRLRFNSQTPYMIVGLVLWVSVLKSGVHATLAGVALAFFIPYHPCDKTSRSLLKELEGNLHNVVSFFVLPVFAFANAGVTLKGMSWNAVVHSIPLGIMAGLVVGKTVGVYGFTWLGVKTGLTKLPNGMTWLNLLGISLLTGIGFTMSLFIASLAFDGDIAYPGSERLGIILGSTFAAISAYIVLHFTLPKEGSPKRESRPE